MKLSANHIIKILILFLFSLPLTFAQQDTLQKKVYNITDTAAFSRQDTVQKKNDNPSDTSFIMSKLPWGAVLRSAVLPGWGQIYTESYWKAPVVWGAAVWLIYNWRYNNTQYKQNLVYYGQHLNDSNPNIPKQYLSNAKFYQDQRDLFAIYLGLTYLLNLVDAYIDAQLFDFSVTNDSGTNTPMLNMRINF